MTQFAVFTGPKPKFRSYEAVSLKDDCVNDYVGDALNSIEREQSWVLRHPNEEVIDCMCCDAMDAAQIEHNIENTELYEFLALYMPKSKAVTFFYATESENLPEFTDQDLFIEHIVTSLSGKIGAALNKPGPGLEVYAKYTAIT